MISGTSLLLCVCLLIFWQVGSDFGYFPKDLLEVNHNYTNEELELPTDVSFFFFIIIIFCDVTVSSAFNTITGKKNGDTSNP